MTLVDPKEAFERTMTTALKALQRLQAGNRRFRSGSGPRGARTDAARRAELTTGQAPFAAVLGCADSRVPPEVVFDQGLGELFVVRVAGNLVGPHALGSLEFAVEQLGVRLVVVLGHTDCGAIQAALDAVATGSRPSSPGLASIVDGIGPVLTSLRRSSGEAQSSRLVSEAVRANVRFVEAELTRQSDLLARLMDSDGLVVVGAEYSLETGAVEFLSGLTEAEPS